MTKHHAAACCGCAALTWFILLWIVQGLLYALATSANGCRAKSLIDYNYKAAGGEVSDSHDEVYNILPKMSFLTEKPHVFWGQSFTVMPTSEYGVISSPVGTWWKAWGPLYNTYVYEDILNSKTTISMRENLLRFGQSHRIDRCDGTGPKIEFEEGANFFGNRVRKLFGLTQSFSYKIYMEGKFVATAEEAFTGYSSITIHNHTANDEQLADTILESRDFNGNMDRWLVKNHGINDMPYYVISAASLLYAFHELNNADRQAGAGKGIKTPPRGAWLQASEKLATTAFELPPKVDEDSAAQKEEPEATLTAREETHV